MNPPAPNPTPADHRPVTPIARRVGPPVVIGSALVTAVVLVWLAVAPTAVAGPLTEAPFTVPATLVIPPDADGCLQLVAGDGSVREHCIDELADLDDDSGPVEARFDEQGRIITGRWSDLLLVDPDTGAVLGPAEEATGDVVPEREPGPISEGEQPEPVDRAIGEVAPRGSGVYTDGDQVLRFAEDPTDEPDEDRGRDSTEGEVVLDLEAPPGYRLEGAVLSPDGAWVVALTPGEQVVVAPTDRSSPPYVWVEHDDAYVDLWQGIHWDDDLP